MTLKDEPRLYWVLRLAVAIIGTVLVVSTLAALFAPDGFREPDELSVPAWQRALDAATWFAVGATVLVPHRLTSSGLRFWIKFAVLAGSGLWLLLAAGQLLAGYAAGTKHWSGVVAGIAIAIFALGGAVTLLWRRRMRMHPRLPN